jgi:hypothetical protein
MKYLINVRTDRVIRSIGVTEEATLRRPAGTALVSIEDAEPEHFNATSYSWAANDGWVALDPAHVAIVEAELVEAAKIQELAGIRSQFLAETEALVSSYSQVERESWATQFAEATAYTASSTAATPMLDGILLEDTTETKESLAANILAKAEALKEPVGQAIGRRRKREKGEAEAE